VSLGSIAVAGPRGVVSQAVDVAAELAKIIRDKRLSRAIQGREFVYVEGWTTLGAMLGVTPREVAVEVTADGDYLATVELVRVSDGAIIGRGSALCGTDEPTWANRPRYARRSMAVTRATGKAYRLAFSWVMKLAGYEPTPAEEMPETKDETPAKRQADPEQAAQEPAREIVKQAAIKTANWPAIAARVAHDVPYYLRDGKPALVHILRAAAAEGFAEVTDANAEPLIEALAARVARKQAEAGKSE
jgi:hypothetical protein